MIKYKKFNNNNQKIIKIMIKSKKFNKNFKIKNKITQLIKNILK